jgi:transcription initiation factor TFIID subunit 6
MASGAAVLAAQAIADALNIPLTKPTLLNSIAQEGEQSVQRVIGAAALLSANAFAQRLSTQHINRVLLSDYRPPLIGYDNFPTFSMITICSDPNDLFFPRETAVNLDSCASAVIPAPAVHPFQAQYLLTEGIPSDKKSLSNRRLLAKPPKIEKAAPPAAGSGPSAVELTQRPPIAITRQVYDTAQSVSDVVNGDLQLYFVRIVNLLKDDTVFSNDIAISSLGRDLGLHQLLPYFLQFIFGQIVLHFQEGHLINTLVSLTISLVRNPSIGSELYVHSFLKIAFAVLVGVGLGTALDDDRALRTHAAELLGVVVRKYRREYPAIEQVVFNSLIAQLFSAETTLGAHYGALLGIRELGPTAVATALPHLASYWAAIAWETNAEDKKQFTEVAAIAQLLRRIAEDARAAADHAGAAAALAALIGGNR